MRKERSFSKGKRSRKKDRRWTVILRSILSPIFITLTLILVLLALSELIVYMIDTFIYGNDSYQDWGMVPLVILAVAFPLLLVSIALNYDRLPFFRSLGSKKGKGKRSEMEPLELD